MPRKSAKTTTPGPMVEYTFDQRVYQIDAERRKVYRRFVEIETAKAMEILVTWRATQAQA